MQPGETISPGNENPEEPKQTDQKPVTEAASQPAPAPTPEPTAPQVNQPEPQSGWSYNANDDDGYDSPEASMPDVDPVHWTASEYIAHDKSVNWYLGVVAAAAGIAALLYLLTRDFVSPAVVLILGIAFAAFGARKPQVLNYSIDSSGIHIANKSYNYETFRTFSILEEDAARSILLMPMQRFNLPIAIYYDPADEERIIQALSVHLPNEVRKVSPIDKFASKIRF